MFKIFGEVNIQEEFEHDPRQNTLVNDHQFLLVQESKAETEVQKHSCRTESFQKPTSAKMSYDTENIIDLPEQQQQIDTRNCETAQTKLYKISEYQILF